MPTDDVATIAKGLTKAQRDALAAPEWSMMRQYEAGLLEPLRFGLLEKDGWGRRLTPLGLSVKSYLEAENFHG